MIQRLRLLVGLLGVLPVLFMPQMALAASSVDQGVVRSYGTDTAVRQGMIVSLKSTDTSKVEPLAAQQVTDMFGVVIAPSDAPIAVTGDTGTQAYVATSGQYNVLVSTENGTIHAGDYISASSLNGIGMKADDSEATVLGRASTDLTTNHILQQNVTIKTNHGDQTVALGLIPVAIVIGSNPGFGHGSGNLPGFLQIASTNIANKPVAAARVYLGVAALLLAAFISGSVLYSGVRGSMLSIGRNPLARHAILGSLFQTVAVGVAVFIVGLGGVYLLLRL